MAESIHATVGCAFAADDAAVAALRAFSEAGLIVHWRIGATDRARAEEVARAVDGIADLDPADPLAGLPGVASGSSASSGVNNGAAIGGLVGAAAGVVGGFTPLAAIMPVDEHLRAVAAALLFFAIGASVGGVLGGALGRQPSTHAGFRLIDAMEEGAVAILGTIDADRLLDVRRLLESNRAAEIIVIAHEDGRPSQRRTS